MADEEKPQQEETAKPAVKKMARKKAPAKKRATRKKTAAKKKAAQKSPPPISEKSETVNAESTPAAATQERLAEKPATAQQPQYSPAQPEQAGSSTPRVWWRAALMVVVVVAIFVYIRNVAHNGPAVTGKTVAPSPWAVQEPVMEPAQPHPWELAPAPLTGGFATPAPDYPPEAQQGYSRQEPWQAPQDGAAQQSQPYYPPPPGPYGYPPAQDSAQDYPR